MFFSSKVGMFLAVMFTVLLSSTSDCVEALSHDQEDALLRGGARKLQSTTQQSRRYFEQKGCGGRRTRTTPSGVVYCSLYQVNCILVWQNGNVLGNFYTLCDQPDLWFNPAWSDGNEGNEGNEGNAYEAGVNNVVASLGQNDGNEGNEGGGGGGGGGGFNDGTEGNEGNEGSCEGSEGAVGC